VAEYIVLISPPARLRVLTIKTPKRMHAVVPSATATGLTFDKVLRKNASELQDVRSNI
jgi:hypothetical protein